MSKDYQLSSVQLSRIAEFCSKRRIFWRSELNEHLGNPQDGSSEYSALSQNLKRMMKAGLIQCCDRRNNSHQYILVDPSRVDEIKGLVRKYEKTG